VTTTPNLERRALELSIVGDLAMDVPGVGFSVTTGSQAILLDGVFSVVNMVIDSFTLRVAAVVRRPDDPRYHFGYACFEPLTNTIEGLIIPLL